jgi:hypothetical protein
LKYDQDIDREGQAVESRKKRFKMIAFRKSCTDLHPTELPKMITRYDPLLNKGFALIIAIKP